MTHHELRGIFFCTNCGFDDWIWEPAYQGLGKGPTQYD